MKGLRRAAADPRLVVVALLAIVVLAGALRLYRLPELLVVGTDQARDALVVQRMLTTGEPPLEGPIASIGTYHRGPVYYYLLAGAYWLSAGHPIGGALLTVAFDLAALTLAFVLVRALSGSLAGLTAAGLWAVSPVMITFGRFQWNPQLMPFFILLAFYAALQVARGRGRWLMVVLPAWLIAWQLHDPAILALPALAVLIGWRWRSWWRHDAVVGAITLSVLVVLPFLLRQIGTGARDLVQMGIYLVGGLIGLGPPPDVPGVPERIATALRGMGRGLPEPEIAGLAVVALAAIAVALALWNVRRGVTPEGATVILLAALPLTFALWRAPFHGHYLLMFYPLPLMLAGIGLAAVWHLRPSLMTPIATIFLAAAMATSAAVALDARASEQPSFRRWDNRLEVVRQIIRDAANEPFALRVETDLEGRDAWRAPYEHAFAYAGTPPDSSRVDLPTYVIFEPEDHSGGAGYGGHLVDGVRWVAFPAPLSGAQLLEQQWSFSGRGQGAVSASGEVRLEMRWPWYRLDALSEFEAKPGQRYIVSFEYRVEGGGPPLFAAQAAYLQLLAADGRVLATAPNGAGARGRFDGQWATASFFADTPEQAVRARLILRGRGAGVIHYRAMQVRPVILDAAPR